MTWGMRGGGATRDARGETPWRWPVLISAGSGGFLGDISRLGEEFI